MQIIAREVNSQHIRQLEHSGIAPLLARLYAARGVRDAAEVDTALAHLLPPHELLGVRDAAQILADAIARDARICIVADYDCDGATACAVAVRGLRMLGARHVSYEVPDRVVDGYGLSAAIAQRVHDKGFEVLVTVDNGIGSVEGVAAARALGLTVVVTDHHLPGAVLPQPHAMVNPNQPGCSFASKSMAGVGVMFYVLLALRALLRERGAWSAATQPKLDALLPLVALGTVADVVRLDANNRRLVDQGLQRVRRGLMPQGMRALFEVARRDCSRAAAFDFGFALGPRINAAGRLSDMTIGIECLLSDDPEQAQMLARALDTINRQRQDMEGHMREQAIAHIEHLMGDAARSAAAAITVFDETFHEGVVGIVASRLKERWHRPTFVFAASAAQGKSGELKGSGRSIAGFHLRDALDLIAKRHPGLLLRFGGHAMAAGCTIVRERVDEFEQALAQVAQEWLSSDALALRVFSDGALAPELRCAQVVDTLAAQVWGQGFEPPLFDEPLPVVSQRVIGSGHLKMQVLHHEEIVDAIWFGRSQPIEDAVPHLAYRVEVNEWRGQRRVQFLIEGQQGAN